VTRPAQLLLDHQRLVEREDARPAGPGVAHTNEFHGSKDGGKGSGAQTAVRVEHCTARPLELQSRPHISVAAELQMGLEEQALDLTAFSLLLGFDLVERELEGVGRRQPGLQQEELNQCRSRINRETSCCCHVLTVI